ncbi:MAG: acyl-CoA mutase large subunit family protein [Planctomycetota bacterium]|jgi:methylmalonyl-CoA mutase N-terminal domain/subunit
MSTASDTGSGAGSGAGPDGGPKDGGLARWIERVYRPALRGADDARRTASGLPVEPLYVPSPAPSPAPAPAPGAHGEAPRLGFPGEFPFTRGPYPSMYRGRPWTMRQYSGFSSAEETNARFRYLLEHGQKGLSVAFDLPTQMGYDPDDPLAQGEVGRVGVSIATVADVEQLFAGIPLGEVSISMTINSTAPVLLAFLVTAARRQGTDPAALRGTLQNDLLKEYIARGTYRFPPAPSLRLVTDVIAWCHEHAPRWNPISISGYHMREAGSTAPQELAFTLANGLEYVGQAVARGLAPDEFAGRLSFFFNAHNDLLEEVAKFRAARRMWATLLRERFDVRNEDALRLRFHTQTAGSTLTSRQPEVNVVRVTLQALSAVLGGTQSLHTNSRDEALGLPTEEAALLALRTQQVLAEESGVTATIDPLGGAPYVEALTDALEAEARGLIAEIDARGGALAAVEQGYQQQQIHRAAYEHARAVEDGKRRIVGVNCYTIDDEAPPPALRLDPDVGRRRVEALGAWRAARDGVACERALGALAQDAAAQGEAAPNLMPRILGAVEAGATVGEICARLQSVFGRHEAQAFL